MKWCKIKKERPDLKQVCLNPEYLIFTLPQYTKAVQGAGGNTPANLPQTQLVIPQREKQTHLLLKYKSRVIYIVWAS